MVGNNEYETNGIHLGARPRLNRGRLSAYLAPRLHARELPKLLALALAGRVRENHNFEWFMARELLAETPESRSLRVAVDGEVVLMTTPLHYRVRPLALRVIAPSNGLPRAAPGPPSRQPRWGGPAARGAHVAE
jgi:diacylglycerol kinase family enzyme